MPRWAAITHRREALTANTDRRVALARQGNDGKRGEKTGRKPRPSPVGTIQPPRSGAGKDTLIAMAALSRSNTARARGTRQEPELER